MNTNNNFTSKKIGLIKKIAYLSLCSISSLMILGACSKNNNSSAVATAHKELETSPVASREIADTRPGHGKDFNTGRFLVNFDPVSFMNSIGDTRPPNGAVYVIIKFNYKNISSKPISALSAPNFFLKDGAGTKYDGDVQAVIAWNLAYNTDEKVLSNINPRITIAGVAVFEIAREAILENGWSVYVDSPSGDEDFMVPFEVVGGDFSVHADWPIYVRGIKELQTVDLLSAAAAEKLMFSKEVKEAINDSKNLFAMQSGSLSLLAALGGRKLNEQDLYDSITLPRASFSQRKVIGIENDGKVGELVYLSVKPIKTGPIYDYIINHKDTEPKAYKKLIDEENARESDFKAVSLKAANYDAKMAADEALAKAAELAKTKDAEAKKAALEQAENSAIERGFSGTAQEQTANNYGYTSSAEWKDSQASGITMTKASYDQWNAEKAASQKRSEEKNAAYQAEEEQKAADRKQLQTDEKHARSQRSDSRALLRDQQGTPKEVSNAPGTPDAAKDLEEAAKAVNKVLKKLPFGR